MTAKEKVSSQFETNLDEFYENYEEDEDEYIPLLKKLKQSPSKTKVRSTKQTPADVNLIKGQFFLFFF